MAVTYSLSTGARKALWQVLYLAVAAELDAILKLLTGSEEAKTWPLYPVVICGLTILGNWLKVRRGKV